MNFRFTAMTTSANTDIMDIITSTTIGTRMEDTPILIRADGKIAGFALICPHCDYRDEKDARCFGEFFVMLKYRRMGIGKQVAMQLFDRHRGHWEVCYWKNNLPASLFWKEVVEEYTNGNYHICGTESNHNCGFIFDN